MGKELPTVKLLTAIPHKLDPTDDAFGEFSNISHPDKWKLVYFYPKDFTFICPTEILRTLLALRAGGLTTCSWKPGEKLL